jgi:hypothetical protein
MDYAVIAATVLNFIIPFLKTAGEKLAEGTGSELGKQTIGNLFTTIQKRFKGKKSAEAALSEVEGNPDSEHDREILKQHLQQFLGEDAAFAKEITDLLDDAKRVGAASERIYNITTSGDYSPGNVEGNYVVNGDGGKKN